MKKNIYLLLLFISIFIFSCGSEDETSTLSPPVSIDNSSISTTAVVPEETTAEFLKGKNLIGQNDCNTCHHVSKNIVGPNFMAIAQKYENNPKNITKLMNSVIKGSKGTWGEVPMTPHASLKKADIHEMIIYILSLK